MKASLLNYDSHSTSGLDVKQHERLQNTDRVLGTGHYVRRGGRKKKEEGGRRFYLEGVRSLIARYILRGIHRQRWVRQLNSRVQTIYVKQ